MHLPWLLSLVNPFILIIYAIVLDTLSCELVSLIIHALTLATFACEPFTL